MSDIKKEVVDTTWEHSQHNTFDSNCSECFKERIQIDSEDMMVGVDDIEVFEGDELGFSPEE